MKKTTKKQCYQELERLARVVCEQKIEKDDLPAFRLCFRSVLDELAKIHDAERKRAEEREIEKNRRKHGL